MEILAMAKIDRTKPLPTEGLVKLHGYGLLAQVLAGFEIERERQGLTKADIAGKLEVAPARVTEWTSGKVIPGVDVVERWAVALGIRIHLVPTRGPSIDPETLTDEQLARVMWALKYKSRRVAKSVMSAFLDDGHATAADVDAAQAHLAEHPRRDEIEQLAEDNRSAFESK